MARDMQGTGLLSAVFGLICDASGVLDDVNVIVDDGPQSSMSPRIQTPGTRRGRRDQRASRSRLIQ